MSNRQAPTQFLIGRQNILIINKRSPTGQENDDIIYDTTMLKRG